MATATSRNACLRQPLLFVAALILFPPTWRQRNAAWAWAARPNPIDRSECTSRMASNGEAEDPASAACYDADTAKVPSVSYYSEYHGHTIPHLETVRKALSEGGEDGGDTEIVYLMGDSTLDNKHWLFLDDDNFASHPSKEAFLTSDPNNGIVAEAINGYEKVLDPPVMVMDVCYWMNKLAAEESSRNVRVINAAVEESTVSERSDDDSSRKSSPLLPQDEFVSKNFGPNDTLVVSAGGNDLALLPSQRTQLALQSLAASPHEAIASGSAPGFYHVLDIFHAQVENFVARVINGSASRPKRIVVCLLYYLDETSPVGGSWADPTLEALGYDRDPTTVQLMLKSIYEHVKERGFRLPPSNSDTAAATEVKLFPMFEILDGKDSNDYVQRVEPSIAGGRKIARGLMNLIL